MNNYNKLNHTTWGCKYPLIWILKYRKKVIYGNLRRYLGEVLRELALQKDSNIIEEHLMGDHVHLLISIPPKYAVSQVVGYIKGKSAIHIARTYAGISPKSHPIVNTGTAVPTDKGLSEQ